MSAFTRRALLAAASALPALSARAAAPSASAPWTPDGTEIAARIRRGETTAAEVVEDAIRKAEALQPKLNFVVNSAYDRALDEARKGGRTGPFAGLPVFIKDLNDARGLPTRYGSRWALGMPPAATQDAYVDAFEKAGFIVIGKSSTPEHGFLPTTEPLGFGPTRNPWNLTRSAGGSSGGSAAATAAGVIPIGHANDGGGSIRIPASCCGLFGLKPSRARMIEARPSRRAIDLAVEHCVTRSVRDSAALFAVTENTAADAPHKPVGLIEGPSKKRLRVGLVFETGTGLEPDAEVRAAIESTAALLRDLGHTVEPTKWPINGPQFAEDFTIVWSSGAAVMVRDVTAAIGRAPDDTVLEPFSLRMAELVAELPKGAAEAAVGRLEAASVDYDRWFESFDVILSPVLAQPPVPLEFTRGDVPFEELQARLAAYVGYTPVHNVAGAPAMSVPLYWTQDGLPVGSHLAGRAGSERMLFELAYELEQARPWAHLRPPVHA